MIFKTFTLYIVLSHCTVFVKLLHKIVKTRCKECKFELESSQTRKKKLGREILFLQS